MRESSFKLWQMKDGQAFISGNKTYLKVRNIKGLNLSHADSQMVLDIESGKIYIHKNWSKGIIVPFDGDYYVIKDSSFINVPKNLRLVLNVKSGRLELFDGEKRVKEL